MQKLGVADKSIPWRAQAGPQLIAIQKHLIPELFFGGAVGGGKLLALDTRLPTPHGWTTMGALSVGDELFDARGAVCRVSALFDVEAEPDLRRLTFDDGSTVDACVDHKWLTYDTAELQSMTRGAAPIGTIRTTGDIESTLFGRNGANHAIPVAGVLNTPQRTLPLDPYLLGAWLGDGTAKAGSVTSADPEIFAAFAAQFTEGATQSSKSRAVSRAFLGLRTVLRKIGVLGDKHIPGAYLRAAPAQRLALLQGLMDTDGTVAKNSGSAEFCNTNERIIDGVVELIHSLGMRVTKRAGRAKLNGKDCGAKWMLKWLPSEKVFRLPRKALLQKIATRRTCRLRYVKSAVKIPSRPGRCIAVDSPSRLFLCGDAMIPTHNSDYLLGDFGQDVPRFGAAWRGVIFRKSYPQLEELINRALEIYPPWFGLKVKNAWEVGKTTFHWPNGAFLKFRHLEDDDAWTAYQGHQYCWLGFDELPQWHSPKAYLELKTRLRSASPIPNKRIRSTGNPGGVGHGWIKKYFGIDRHPHGSVIIEPDSPDGMRRMFIRSRVQDNKILLANDPGYIARLRDLGSEVLVRQYLEGDWAVVAGAFFNEFSVNRHVIAPFAIPKEWMKFRSFDWGAASPFSVGWYAVATDDYLVTQSSGAHVRIPRGALVKYREWYGAKEENKIMVGIKMPMEEIAEGILAREADDEVISMSVADPKLMSEDGGPSLAERASKVFRVKENGTKVFCTFQRADNERKAGWDMVRMRLKGEVGESEPMIYFFTTCEDTIRTLPGLQHDKNKPEDVDTRGEDHCGDELRYSCMARPWIRRTASEIAPRFAHTIKTVGPRVICTTTGNDLIKARRAARLSDA